MRQPPPDMIMKAPLATTRWAPRIQAGHRAADLGHRLVYTLPHRPQVEAVQPEESSQISSRSSSVEHVEVSQLEA